MATAEEILLAAGEEKNVQPDVLIIDNDLRTITIPESVKILGVEGDDDVKRLRFKMPRAYGEFDLGVFAVHVVYVNANNEPDMYLVTDAQRGVDEITFSWLVGENALKYKGETQFAVHLRRVADGKVVQRFNTEPAKIRVLNGLDTDISPEEEEKARDIITQLINMLSEQADEKIKEAQEAGAAQVNAVNVAGAVQVAAIEAKGEATLASIPADYTTLGNDVSQLKDTKADAIADTSAKAARHTLHAQRGPMGVTLFGKTTETGTGDKSPDNPYEIGGVDAARVHCGGKNLFNMPEVSDTRNGVTYSADGNGAITYLGLSGGTAGNVFMLDIPNPITIQPGMKIVIDATNAPNPHGLNFRNTVTGDNRTLNSSPGKVIAFNVGASHAGQTFNHVRDWISREIEYNDTLKIMFTYSDDNEFEPYTANVITPPLLPDGAPLMGNGTVDDTVENDVLSGCDKCVTFDGSEDEKWAVNGNRPGGALISAPESVVNSVYFSNYLNRAIYSENFGTNANSIYISAAQVINIRIDSLGVGATIEQIRAYLSANPLKVYYRSTDYTPDKDLRVCRVVRKWKTVVLDGTESITAIDTDAGTLFSFVGQMRGASGDLAVKGGICSHFPVGSTSTGNSVQGCGGWNEAFYIRLAERFATTGELTAWLAEEYAAGTPVTVWYNHAPDETYVTDPFPLRKPDTLTTDTVTVTGSGETAVSYPHDTKHYIDSKISELVTLALANH